MSFFKTIPNKTLFYGGWFLEALASFVVLITVFGSDGLRKIPVAVLDWYIVVIFGAILLMFLMGNEFIKQGLKPKESKTKC